MEHSRKLCLLAFILATNNVVALLSNTVDQQKDNNKNNTVILDDDKVIHKRHTPFLPGDYWKDRRPEFGDTQTEVETMVNGTARLKCPISHVADSSVSSTTMLIFAVLPTFLSTFMLFLVKCHKKVCHLMLLATLLREQMLCLRPSLSIIKILTRFFACMVL